MENKKQVSHASASASASSSSMNLDHLFGPRDSSISSASSSSTSGLFNSIFPPPSTGVARDQRKQDLGNQVGSTTAAAGKYGASSGFSDNYTTSQGGITSKDSIYQNEAHHVEPCYLSSSIYYGGRENYSPRTTTATTTQSHHNISNKDGGDEDPNGNSASRGNWWKGSLYY